MSSPRADAGTVTLTDLLMQMKMSIGLDALLEAARFIELQEQQQQRLPDKFQPKAEPSQLVKQGQYMHVIAAHMFLIAAFWGSTRECASRSHLRSAMSLSVPRKPAKG